MASDLYQFRTPAGAADPSPLGIEVYDCGANATYQVIESELWKALGAVFVYDTGRIVVSHVSDALPIERRLLTGHAEQVWAGVVRPSAATGWRFRRRKGRPNYWSSNILRMADLDHDPAAAAINASCIPVSLNCRRFRAEHAAAEEVEA